MSFVRVPNILFDSHKVTEENKTRRVKYYDLKPVDFRVYLYLLSCNGFADEEKIKLKYRTIAEHCGIGDPKTVIASVNRLVSQGLLKKYKRYNKFGHNAANGYQLPMLPGGFFMFDTAYFNSGLSVSDMCILLYLIRCKDKNQFSFPSLSTIAYIVNLSKVTVRKSITWLTQRLFVQKNHRLNQCGDFRNNLYRIYSFKEQFELLKPYRKIRGKTPDFLRKALHPIVRKSLTPFLLVWFHIFFKLEVGKKSPNTS